MITKKIIWKGIGIIIFIYMIYRGFTFEVEPKVEAFETIFTDYKIQLALLENKVFPLYSIGSVTKIGKVTFTKENGLLFLEIESGNNEGIGAINLDYSFEEIHTQKSELDSKIFGNNIIWIALQNNYGIVVSLGKKEWLSTSDYDFNGNYFFTVSILSQQDMNYFIEGTMGNKTNHIVYARAYDRIYSGFIFP